MTPLDELFSSPHVGPNHAADLILLRSPTPGPQELLLDGKPVTAAFARAELVAAGVPRVGVCVFLATAVSAAEFYREDQPRGAHGMWGGTAHPDTSPQIAHESPEAAKRVQALSTMDMRLGISSGLSREQRTQYRDAAASVINAMTEGALDRWNANVAKMVFAKDLPDVATHVNYALHKMHDDTKIPPNTIGCCVRSPGADTNRVTVIVDGGIPGEPPLSQGSIAGIYAHEFSHAIDGSERTVSGTPEWEKAWDEEINNSQNPPSDYAKSSPLEGFAEFGRLVFTHPRAASTMYPKCAAIWKTHGLIH